MQRAHLSSAPQLGRDQLHHEVLQRLQRALPTLDSRTVAGGGWEGPALICFGVTPRRSPCSRSPEPARTAGERAGWLWGGQGSPFSCPAEGAASPESGEEGHPWALPLVPAMPDPSF